MFRIILAAGAALALTACTNTGMGMGAGAQAGAGMGGMGPLGAPGQRGAPRAVDYAQMAAASDRFEIESSQTALQVSQNPSVRQFAQMLIDHHTMMTQTLASAAQASGMAPPPPVLDPRKQTMLQQLRSAGAHFDHVYVDQQIMAHQEALTLHQSYAAGGDVPQLRAAAGAAVPIVQQHLQQAQAMRASMGGM